ncbi:MarR family winged helix-turn-helix transcriptional regulator [Methyloraptor flagellatus]|uniref:MarR family transcriptional regulator n=1 Tax=Methyloraptor flagellatus TaxID=3162530 RepID=A0AAU7X8K4_9HYPH
MHERLTANRLAALATALDDAMTAETDGLSESAVAALLVVRRSEPVPIQDIARTIGLTHSATVRLIDRLEEGWLVRRLSRKGREVSVETTARGKRRASQLQDRRIGAADALIGALDEEERALLAGLIDRMLEVPVDGRARAERICRLCDHGVCRGADCPVDAAADRMDAAKSGAA